MILDIQFFSYGAGLVVLGWVVGMAVGVLFRIVGELR